MSYIGYGDGDVSQKGGRYRCLRISDISSLGTANVHGDGVFSSDSRFLLKEGDIIFARVGGKEWKSYLYDPKDGPLTFGSFLMRFCFDMGETHPGYVRYFALSPKFQRILSLASHGSTRGLILPSAIGEAVLPCTDRDRQAQIAAKIDPAYRMILLLKEKRQLLLSYAKDAYRHRFQGGGEPGTLGDLVTFRSGRSRKACGGTVPVYNSGGITGMADKPDPEREAVLVAKKGSLNRMVYAVAPFSAGGTMCVATGKFPGSLFYAYSVLKGYDLSRLDTDSVSPGVSMRTLAALPCHIPSHAECARFEKEVRPAFENAALLGKKERLAERAFSGLLNKYFP